MSDHSRGHNVTELLLSWGPGDTAALDRLVPLLYDDLRRVARRHLRRERPGHSLQATALVHEVFLRLVDVDRMTLKSRTHFFALSARLMRQILVDAARHRRRDKRGGGQEPLALENATLAVDDLAVEVLDLDGALGDLARRLPRQAQVVECLFFGGLSVEETAEALDLSQRSVKRDWALARAWLYRRLKGRS